MGVSVALVVVAVAAVIYMKKWVPDGSLGIPFGPIYKRILRVEAQFYFRIRGFLTYFLIWNIIQYLFCPSYTV